MGSSLESSLLSLMLLASACDGGHTAPTRRPEARPALPAASESQSERAIASPLDASPPDASASAPEPVRVELAEVDAGRSVFVLRGSRGTHPAAFLHGLCGHPQAYLMSFQNSAADYGPFIAPNGDLPCNGPYRSWSGRLPPLDAQIREGLALAGVSGEPTAATLVGYSMGGSRALELARLAPERYTRLILIATPETPSPRKLERLSAAVMMAGTRDRQDQMKAGQRAFERAGIPSTFMALPGASHGEMGPDAERVMGEALGWLGEHAR